MASDPKFVRLRTDLRGRYDLISGWSIAGLDVKPMPDKETRPKAYAYVKRELAAGRIEGASKAEHDETQVDLVQGDDSFQERAIRDRATEAHSRIVASRKGDDETLAHEADAKRRKAIIKQQKAAAKGRAAAEDDDDDDDTDEYDAMNKNALQARAAERGVSASGSAEDIRARLRAADEGDSDDDEDEGDGDDSDDDGDDDAGDDSGDGSNQS